VTFRQCGHQRFHDPVLFLGRDAAGRLVHDQELWLQHERHRHVEELALSFA
jgi:hypothetical protein